METPNPYSLSRLKLGAIPTPSLQLLLLFVVSVLHLRSGNDITTDLELLYINSAKSIACQIAVFNNEGASVIIEVNRA